MLTADYYKEIFKRKSFHLFRGCGDARVSEEELQEICEAYEQFESLYPEIKTVLRIVPADKVNFKRDAEYCLMIYSEKKENYLLNAGYIGEQLDLFLARKNIGALWYGIGKPDEAMYDGLSYVIMIAIHKISDETMFRKDMFKSKRKKLEETWSGETLGVGEIAMYAPSACNSQPWFVQNEAGLLTVERLHKSSKVGLMLPSVSFFYNRIDMGIYLCFLEICLAQKQLAAERTLFPDEENVSKSKVAEYRLMGTGVSDT